MRLEITHWIRTKVHHTLQITKNVAVTLSARIEDSLGENRVGSNPRCRCAAMRGLGATIPNCVPHGAAFLLIRHT